MAGRVGDVVLYTNEYVGCEGLQNYTSKLEPIHDIVFHEKGVVYVISNWKTTNHSLTPPFSFDIHNTVLPRTWKI
jgi:hypothetical protein